MKKTLNVKGLHCPSCEMLVADGLEDIGVKARLNHKSGKADVEYDDKKVTIEEIKEVIKNEGYEVSE